MSLLHAGEGKVPEIMVHKLQEALAKQLDMFGLGVTATVTPSFLSLAPTQSANFASKLPNMQKQTKYAKYAKTN